LKLSPGKVGQQGYPNLRCLFFERHGSFAAGCGGGAFYQAVGEVGFSLLVEAQGLPGGF
jgi:hypothetical protein